MLAFDNPPDLAFPAGSSHGISVEFFRGDAATVARGLLGKRLERGSGSDRVVVEIVDVQAYPGGGDPQTKSYRGASSQQVTWGAGALYVYSVQGHTMMTVAVPPYTGGECVLIRGVRVVEGDAVVRDAGVVPGANGLIDGPGKVSRALGIAVGDNGMNLLNPGASVRIVEGVPVDPTAIVTGGRISGQKVDETSLRFLVASSG
jgi:DNA-3-methyladenine glycosylase